MLDARFLTGLSDGGAVTTWTSRTGTNSPTQGTAGARPTYKTAIRAGCPVVRFDGGDTLISGSFSSAPSFTCLTVFSASSNGFVYERGTSAAVSGDHFLYTTNGACSFASGAAYPTNSSGRNIGNNWGIGSVWRVVTQVCDGTHAGNEVFINGVASTNANQSGETGNPGTSTYSLALHVGSRAGSSLFLTGDIAALVLVSPILPAPMRRRLAQGMALTFKIASQ